MANNLEAPHRPHQYVPAKKVDSDYPLIDSDPHFKRVVSYARPSDWLVGAGVGSIIPVGMFVMERVSPAASEKEDSRAQ
ncbi:hypothetical protein H2203_007294 [Taxawa tesnikishii (nom. ined.)]|nr:hypothetical protein H2203_007294 [Dothideales sp. JES 119]